MREISFKINVFLTLAATLFTVINFVIIQDDVDIPALAYLGFFQIITSITLTLYSVIKDPKLTALYLIYWLIVIVFFKYLFHSFFYGCIIIAFYNLYAHYCSFSDSKYNITKLWP